MIFSTKVLRCQNYAEVRQKVESMEEDWIWALLSRFNVSPDIIKRAQHDPTYPKYEWRDYLLATFGLQIEKDFALKKTIVTRTNFKKGDMIIVGEWHQPEIIQIREGKHSRYEVHLKYFSLI
jgi:hypothetical protein